jgi:hypothetical protein
MMAAGIHPTGCLSIPIGLFKPLFEKAAGNQINAKG